MKSRTILTVILALAPIFACVTPRCVRAAEPLDLGTKREIFVDDYLIDKLEGTRLVMGQAKDEGVAILFDQPWEGPYSDYASVMKVADDDYRMYYRGAPRLVERHKMEQYTCVALSKDGINWERPNLGLHEIHGTKENNVILTEHEYTHNFAPFVDKPGTPKSERFKAVAGERFTGLVAFSSEDGIHWKKMFGGKPVFKGKFLDSLNIVFWSEAEKCYVLYGRTWLAGWGGRRWIARATSEDLEHWTAFEDIQILHGGKDVPPEHYYTNGTRPYFRAPHIYISTFGQIIDGGVLTPAQIATLKIDDQRWPKARSNAGLMSSRGGLTFQRTFMEDFIRLPIGAENWVSRCYYPAAGVVQTGPAEMSIYLNTTWGQPTRSYRRFSLRLDGFASLNAPFSGGTMITKPFTFEGKKLAINYSTSARGHIRLQFETPQGEVIEGFELKHCHEFIGNEIERHVTFHGSDNLSKLAGKSVRLRVIMQDADLYSIQFQK